MTKENRNFAKLDPDTSTPVFGPLPLIVITHHHEEWDAPVLDRTTGEPTGETEHCVRDYDTSKTEMRPTADDYRQMGYLPYSDKLPEEPAPEGKHYIPSGWETVADTMVRRTYVLVDDPPPPPRTFSRFQLYLCLAPMGLWEPLMAWLATKTYNSIKADVAFNQAQEFKEDHPLFRQWLGEAQAALEVDDATVEQILAASVKVED